MTPKLLTVKQFAAELTLSPKTIWNWVGERKIAVQRIGRVVRIPESEVQRILEEGYMPARTKKGRAASA